MNKYKLKTKQIKDLECEIKKGNNNAVDEFLFYLEKNGTPLIEKIEDDTDNLLVTFIYPSNEPIENVLFSSSFSFCLNNFEENKLEQINFFFIMPNSEEDFWTKERINVPKGNLQEYKFESKNFKESRKIYCYTPYGYNEEGEPYGFIVLTDANQYIKKLSAIQVLDNLIADKKVPPVVAILIDSTETRYEELTCNDIFCNTIG